MLRQVSRKLTVTVSVISSRVIDNLIYWTSQSKKLLYAQDAQTHEVVIKIVARDTDSYAIYKLLKESPEAFDDDDFCGVLPPVDILEYDKNHVFVVLPRSVQYRVDEFEERLITHNQKMGGPRVPTLVLD